MCPLGGFAGKRRTRRNGTGAIPYSDLHNIIIVDNTHETQRPQKQRIIVGNAPCGVPPGRMQGRGQATKNIKKVIKMLKRALKFAIGPSIGVALGGTIIPRLVHPYRYNETYPPLIWHGALALVFSYFVCFLIILLLECLKVRAKNNRELD